MTTWTDIFPDVDGPPVVGDPSEFSAVARGFDSMNEAAQYIEDQFALIQSDAGSDKLQGDVAVAFERFVNEVADSLGDLPRVCEEARVIFADHATKLSGLQTSADRALARARTAWSTKNTLETQVSNQQNTVENLGTQVDSAADDDPNKGQLDSELSSASSRLGTLRGQLDDVDGTLREIRGEWTSLRGDEEHLRDETGGELDDIDLGDLKDPGRFASFINAAFEFMLAFTPLDEIIGWVVDIVEAALNGDWAAVLWKLRDALDVVIAVVAIVALFTPLGPVMLAVVFGLALAKLAVDVTLYAQRWPDPETGKVINMGDVIMSGVGVALAGVGGVLGLKALKSASTFAPYGASGQMTALSILRSRSAYNAANIADKRGILAGLGLNSTVVNGTVQLSRIDQGKIAIKLFGLTNIPKAAYKAPKAITPVGDRLSTDVFQSIADGYSTDHGTDKLVYAVFPTPTPTCQPA